MRWRPTFMAEVHQSLQQLGMTACPVCGSAEFLGISPFPVLLANGEFPPDADGDDCEGDLTFAIRVDCIMCGHLMLFDSTRYRTGDEKIMMLGLAGESEDYREE